MSYGPPMTPAELRPKLDRQRLLRYYSAVISQLADSIVAGTPDLIQTRVAETEKVIKELSIEIRRMKDENPT